MKLYEKIGAGSKRKWLDCSIRHVQQH